MKNHLATILLILTTIIIPGGSLILISALVARHLKGNINNGSSNSKTGTE